MKLWATQETIANNICLAVVRTCGKQITTVIVRFAWYPEPAAEVTCADAPMTPMSSSRCVGPMSASPARTRVLGLETGSAKRHHDQDLKL